MTGARTQPQEQGFILTVVLGAILIVTLAGSTLLSGGIARTNQSLRTYHRANALHLAEAGLYQASQHLQTELTTDDIMAATIGTGAFTIESQEPFGNNLYQVVSKGVSAAEQRRVEAVFRFTGASVFQYAVLGDAGVSLAGNLETDSYDSRFGLNGAYQPDPDKPNYNKGHEGSVATNSIASGALNISGTSLKIDGQLMTGPNVANPTALVTGYTAGVITGGTDPPSDTQDVGSLPTKIPLAPVVLPAGMTCSPSETVKANQTLPLTSTGGPLGNGTYCYQDLSVEGGGKVTVSGPVKLYLTGTMQAVGNTEIGDPTNPTNLIVYITSGGTATITGTFEGSNKFYGGIYAPDATIAIGGNAQIFGAVAAENVYLAGDAQIHYDVAMRSISNGPRVGTTQPIAWREL